MPSSLTIKMTGDKDKMHGPYMASLLQGVMMDMVDTSYADILHESGIHPYSQYAEEKDGEILWHINALTREADEAIIEPLKSDDFSEIELTHRQEILQIKEKVIRNWNFEELIEGYYLNDCGRYLPLHIITPMAFKQNGRYCIIPSTRLIFQNLLRRFDTCSTDSTIFTDELLSEFEYRTEIVDYRLRSVRFSLSGVKIPSFIGDLKICISGPQQMVNAAWMLAKFGEYSGIGIKTGMGMGAVVIEDYHRKK